MKFRNACLLVAFIFVVFDLMAQPDTNHVSRNVVYIEAFGIGGYGSLNYERNIPVKAKLRIGLRIGVSTYNITDYTTEFNPDIIIPIAINGSYGNDHKIEFGFGQTISNMVRVSHSNWQPERETYLHANITFGYRYQKDKRGVVIRCAYTPIIEFYKFYRHWGGISIGYAF